MKTKRIILICVGVLLGALLIAILVNAIIKHEYFVVRGILNPSQSRPRWTVITEAPYRRPIRSR